MRRQLLLGLSACAISLLVAPALAQEWPSNSQLPIVTTRIEVGFAGLSMVAIGGVPVPASTPAPVVAQIKALRQTTVRQTTVRHTLRARLDASGYEIRSGTPEQFTADLNEKTALTERMMRSAVTEAQ